MPRKRSSMALRCWARRSRKNIERVLRNQARTVARLKQCGA
jgi:hypothetical protein